MDAVIFLGVVGPPVFFVLGIFFTASKYYENRRAGSKPTPSKLPGCLAYLLVTIVYLAAHAYNFLSFTICLGNTGEKAGIIALILSSLILILVGWLPYAILSEKKDERLLLGIYAVGLPLLIAISYTTESFASKCFGHWI